MNDAPAKRPPTASRRTVALSAAWTIPTIVVATSAPALASSYGGETLVSCPAATAIQAAPTAAIMSNYGSTWTLNQQIFVPPALLSSGATSATVSLFTFDGNPYTNFVYTGWNTTLANGAAQAPGFELTGAGAGASLINTYREGASRVEPMIYFGNGTAEIPINVPGSSEAQATPFTGCTSFQFQIGWLDNPPGGTNAPLTTVPPVPQYCNYYWNGCVDANGIVTGVSVTSSALY